MVMSIRAVLRTCKMYFFQYYYGERHSRDNVLEIGSTYEWVYGILNRFILSYQFVFLFLNFFPFLFHLFFLLCILLILFYFTHFHFNFYFIILSSIWNTTLFFVNLFLQLYLSCCIIEHSIELKFILAAQYTVSSHVLLSGVLFVD
jgi:hypothetical protein